MLVRGALSILFLLCLSFLLSSCSSFQPDGIENAKKREIQVSDKKLPSGHFIGQLSIKPIDLEGELFHSVADWYNDNSILYIANKLNEQGSIVYRYHLYTGQKEVFYETPNQVITLEGSENGTYFAIHTSVTTNEATIIILDRDGNELINTSIESAELQYIWNPLAEEQMFITTFQDDWSFENYLIDLTNKSIEVTNVNQPFIQWRDQSELLYLKWDTEQSGNTAPLYSYQLDQESEEMVKEGILGYHTYHSLLMTVSPIKDQSLYQFFHPKSMKLIQSFQIPSINTYSDQWWIPHYDYNHNRRSFFFYKPVYDGNEFKSLQLTNYSLENGVETVILEGVEDVPIHLSPDGSLSLIGFQYEEILDLTTKEVKPLIR